MTEMSPGESIVHRSVDTGEISDQQPLTVIETDVEPGLGYEWAMQRLPAQAGRRGDSTEKKSQHRLLQTHPVAH